MFFFHNICSVAWPTNVTLQSLIVLKVWSCRRHPITLILPSFFPWNSQMRKCIIQYILLCGNYQRQVIRYIFNLCKWINFLHIMDVLFIWSNSGGIQKINMFHTECRNGLGSVTSYCQLLYSSDPTLIIVIYNTSHVIWHNSYLLA